MCLSRLKTIVEIMKNIQVDRDNLNILTQDDIEDFGLEEADAAMGPSWDEVEAALKEKKDGQGKEQ